PWARALPHLGFAVVFALLNAIVNVRYPSPEPAFWYLTPSVDILVMFAVFAWLGWSGKTASKALRLALVAFLLIVRVVRIGDGVQQKYYGDTFHLQTDLRLVPNIILFIRSSVPEWQFALFVWVGLAALLAIVVVCYAALGYAERY